MKKLILSLVVAMTSIAASAQVYVGGEVGFWRNYDDNKTTFSINPHIGYTLDEDWALGLGIGYTHDYMKGAAVNSFQVEPYARYTFAKFGNVSLFLDGGFGFETGKYDTDGAESQNAWYVGIRPGVKVSLTDELDFVAHCGFLGYRNADDHYDVVSDRGYSSFGQDGFGFDVDGNSLTFGLYYNF